jgi:hypothetical protein
MEEVTLVDPQQWPDLSYIELCDQRTIMYDKYEFLVRAKKDYANVVLEGIHRLEGIISQKLGC